MSGAELDTATADEPTFTGATVKIGGVPTAIMGRMSRAHCRLSRHPLIGCTDPIHPNEPTERIHHMSDHTVYRLNKQAEAANALRVALNTEDEQLLHDSIQGETDLQEMIQATILSMDEDTILADGLKTHLESLTKRHQRIRKRIDTKRAAIEQAMVIGEVKTLELPTMTATVKRGAPGLQITDEAAIPADYWKAKEPALDKRALLAAVKEGEVPGAQLDNGGISLQLRRN